MVSICWTLGRVPNVTQIIGYKRVSSGDQNLGRQLDGVKLDAEFEEKVSGKDAVGRPQLQRMLTHVRAGDHVMVHELSRLGRSLRDLLDIVKQIVDKGASIEFVKERLTFGKKDDPYADVLLGILGSFAQFERAVSKQRQREGIDLAMKEGRMKGRPRVLTTLLVAEARRLKAEGENMSDIAEQLGCSRQTLYTALRA
jgi:DNA invertase Pin-like site-specific DNA recombinase